MREAMMASLGAQNWGADEIDPELVSLFSEFAVSSPWRKKKSKTPINDFPTDKKIETPPKVLEEKTTNVYKLNLHRGLGKVRRNKNKKMKISVPLDSINESDEVLYDTNEDIFL
jgi:hypothetical protein